MNTIFLTLDLSYCLIGLNSYANLMFNKDFANFSLKLL